MKTIKKEFDIDFIGGLGPLTKEEEKALSAYFKAKKVKKQVKVKPQIQQQKRKLNSLLKYGIIIILMTIFDSSTTNEASISHPPILKKQNPIDYFNKSYTFKCLL